MVVLDSLRLAPTMVLHHTYGLHRAICCKAAAAAFVACILLLLLLGGLLLLLLLVGLLLQMLGGLLVLHAVSWRSCMLPNSTTLRYSQKIKLIHCERRIPMVAHEIASPTHQLITKASLS